MEWLAVPAPRDACACGDCRRPTNANADVRADHARAHIGFMEWLAVPPTIRRLFVRERA